MEPAVVCIFLMVCAVFIIEILVVCVILWGLYDFWFALVTFITNPFTFPFWAVVANKLGAFLLKVDLAATGGAAQEEITSGRWAWFIELFADVGITVLVTIFGFIVLALVGAALGYLVSSVVWRFVVAHRRKRKLRAMARPAARSISLKGKARKASVQFMKSILCPVCACVRMPQLAMTLSWNAPPGCTRPE